MLSSGYYEDNVIRERFGSSRFRNFAQIPMENKLKHLRWRNNKVVFLFVSWYGNKTTTLLPTGVATPIFYLEAADRFFVLKIPYNTTRYKDTYVCLLVFYQENHRWNVGAHLGFEALQRASIQKKIVLPQNR